MADDQIQDDVGTQIARGDITPGQGVRQQLKQTTDWIDNLAPRTAEEAEHFVHYNTPVVSQALSGRDAYNALADPQGPRYRDAALAAIGMVPALGGIIVGRNSMHPAVAPMIEHAEELAAKGLPQNEVWAQTAARNQHPEAAGAYIGPDGLPRVELDDSKATLSQLRPAKGGVQKFYGLDNPAYERSYGEPDYAMFGNIEPKGPVGSGAYYPPEPGERATPWIKVQARDQDAALDTAHHEIHHDIAFKEGYPEGTNWRLAPFPESGEGGAWPFYHEAVKDTGITLEPHQRFSEKFDQQLKRQAAFDWYRHARGENEAEAVANRRAMTREERIAKPFYESMEYPYWEHNEAEHDMKPHEAAGGAVDHSQHLPEFERNAHPDEAFERAKWMIPYLRAGGEAHKRGEDFYGGTPQYDAQLAALKHYYHGESAPTAEEAPTAPEHAAAGGPIEEEAPPSDRTVTIPPDIIYGPPTEVDIGDTLADKVHGHQPSEFFPLNIPAPKGPSKWSEPVAKDGGAMKRAHGGSAYSKKVAAIHDTFKHKLEGKERLVSSLEKAHTHKPNEKLGKRISAERKEAARIRKHMEKIKSYS